MKMQCSLPYYCFYPEAINEMNKSNIMATFRFILISRSPLSTGTAAGIKRNNTFMIEEKPSGIQEMARVVRSASSGDEMKAIKKSRMKKQNTQPEEVASPPRLFEILSSFFYQLILFQVYFILQDSRCNQKAPDIHNWGAK